VGLIEKIALRVARGRIAGSTCLVANQVDHDHALVQVRSTRGEVSPMPFLREEGMWRFDQRRWEELRKTGKAARP
jgi:hypothetical protein